MYMDYEEGTPEKTEKERRKIIWGYAEQRLAPGLHALLQGSFQSGASKGCKSYAGAGLTWQCGKTEGGLFTDYARFSPSYEWAREFTWKIPCSDNGFIQPTLHFIQQAGAHYLIGLLRFSYVLPTT